MANEPENKPLDDTDALSGGELIGLENDSAPAKAPDPTEGGSKFDPTVEKSVDELLDEQEKSAEELKTEEKPAPEQKEEAKPVPEGAAKLTTEAKTPSVAEEFDKIELGPHARPETRDQFTKIKEVSRQKISETEKKLAEAEKKAAELEARIKSVAELPPETKTELEELRTFRRAFDIERDPVFREQFDKRLEANSTSIIAKLSDIGVSAEKIEQIKKIGVPNVKWDPILEALPPVARRFVENKLVDNETVLQDRKAKIEAAKGDAVAWEQEQKGRSQKVQEEFDSKVISHLQETVKTIPWAHLREVPVGATPEVVAEISAHNKFITEAGEELVRIVADDSPKGRAEMAMAVPQARYYKAQLEAAEKRISELSKKAEELDRIKAARQTTKQTRTAPTTQGRTPSSATLPAGVTREEHLDKMFEEANR